MSQGFLSFISQSTFCWKVVATFLYNKQRVCSCQVYVLVYLCMYVYLYVYMLNVYNCTYTQFSLSRIVYLNIVE